MADKYEVDEEKDNDNSDVDSEDMTDDEDKESSQFSESNKNRHGIMNHYYVPILHLLHWIYLYEIISHVCLLYWMI